MGPTTPDWCVEIREAVSVVDDWIERAAADGWLKPPGAAWTNKDLLGHLTAWSDLLIDQVEALQHGRPETIQAVDVHAWNAVQVAARRECTSEALVDAWRRAAERAAGILDRVPAHLRTASWRVPWADRPVSIGDLVRLWLAHIEQHRTRLQHQGEGVKPQRV